MDIFIGTLAGVVLIIALALIFEYRIRKPDAIILHDKNGQIVTRKGLLYPRHLSLNLKRNTYPVQLDIVVSAKGNLEVRVRLVGSVAPSLDHLQALIRVGGWSSEAVEHAAEEAQVLLQGMVKAYIEGCEIHTLTSTGVQNYLNGESVQLEENLGVELISLAVQSLEPMDTEVADALRQREKARLLEQTEQLKHQARVLAAKARYQADEEIADLNHALELKKVEMNQHLLEKEAALSHQRLEEELERDRMRLALEKEEVEILRSSPELLMLTPQAARLAEASQNLKNARTVISLSPQELLNNADFLGMFQSLLQKALDARKDG